MRSEAVLCKHASRPTCASARDTSLASMSSRCRALGSRSTVCDAQTKGQSQPTEMRPTRNLCQRDIAQAMHVRM